MAMATRRSFSLIGSLVTGYRMRDLTPMPAGRVGFLLGLCLLAAPLLPAAATETEPDFAWSAGAFDGNASLVYGSTETAEDLTFVLFCDNGKKNAELTVYEEVKGAELSQKLSIEIGAGSAKVALKGKTATDEMNGFIYGMAKGFAVKPLLTVLKGSGPATVKMGKAATTLPEKGRAEALGKFAKACRLD